MITSYKTRAGTAWSENNATKLQAKAKLKTKHFKGPNKEETLRYFLRIKLTHNDNEN